MHTSTRRVHTICQVSLTTKRKKKPVIRFTPREQYANITTEHWQQSNAFCSKLKSCRQHTHSVFMQMHKCKMTFTKFSHLRPFHYSRLFAHAAAAAAPTISLRCVERYVFIVRVRQPSAANVPMHLMRGRRKFHQTKCVTPHSSHSSPGVCRAFYFWTHGLQRTASRGTVKSSWPAPFTNIMRAFIAVTFFLVCHPSHRCLCASDV